MSQYLPVGLALGSNLGDRIGNLREARQALAELPGVEGDSLCYAPVYENEPVDCKPGAPFFLNTVVEVYSSLAPEALLQSCQDIEVSLGRPETHGYHADRTIDIDILYMGDLTVSSERLTLPHPLLTNRLFVVRPLANLRPDLVLPPGSGPTMAARVDRFGSDALDQMPLFAEVW
ncbi:MAG: 2-amino-4-hydroxy-6-hydroxymethyldihydropteridine diphosphokinase [Verrucomicrobiota bacterium]